MKPSYQRLFYSLLLATFRVLNASEGTKELSLQDQFEQLLGQAENPVIAPAAATGIQPEIAIGGVGSDIFQTVPSRDVSEKSHVNTFDNASDSFVSMQPSEEGHDSDINGLDTITEVDMHPFKSTPTEAVVVMVTEVVVVEEAAVKTVTVGVVETATNASPVDLVSDKMKLIADNIDEAATRSEAEFKPDVAPFVLPPPTVAVEEPVPSSTAAPKPDRNAEAPMADGSDVSVPAQPTSTKANGNASIKLAAMAVVKPSKPSSEPAAAIGLNKVTITEFRTVTKTEEVPTTVFTVNVVTTTVFVPTGEQVTVTSTETTSFVLSSVKYEYETVTATSIAMATVTLVEVQQVEIPVPVTVLKREVETATVEQGAAETVTMTTTVSIVNEKSVTVTATDTVTVKGEANSNKMAPVTVTQPATEALTLYRTVTIVESGQPETVTIFTINSLPTPTNTPESPQVEIPLEEQFRAIYTKVYRREHKKARGQLSKRSKAHSPK